MELLGIILSAIAAIAAVATLWFSVRTSKGNIHKRIKRKEEQIREIDNKLIFKYGLNRGTGYTGGPITSLDEKRVRLQQEINELRLKL